MMKNDENQARERTVLIFSDVIERTSWNNETSNL